MIAVEIDRNINITIFVYVPVQRLKECFSFEIAWRMAVFEGKNNW